MHPPLFFLCASSLLHLGLATAAEDKGLGVPLASILLALRFRLACVIFASQSFLCNLPLLLSLLGGLLLFLLVGLVSCHLHQWQMKELYFLFMTSSLKVYSQAEWAKAVVYRYLSFELLMYVNLPRTVQ